ncbi:hypothetical protein V8C86DRAFT_83460 [Haematococcus lacustris]
MRMTRSTSILHSMLLICYAVAVAHTTCTILKILLSVNPHRHASMDTVIKRTSILVRHVHVYRHNITTRWRDARG